ncbi:hypothetical protein [Niabella ginsengisoli]|uniref:Uncharacterized protein n=1 Tax=Niabella ginsengisoli TaxID=522298 RepID=A0ABS9SDZ2_9BACT|nr:hypothetical protein [Niabella ginsengisoli]MCH5596576.1 hypothetical protein [Niabella ginsengisoli]
MKNAIAFLIACICFFCVNAQTIEKSNIDIILKTNGDELQGKVVEIEDDEVKFTYEGESLIYKIKKQDIVKVTYGSAA